MSIVSIIIPCYNSGISLKFALDSIIDNTKHPYEIILIESESTDGTDKLCNMYAQKYPHIKVYHTKKEGITKAVNLGIRVAGENDVFLMQDDVIIPRLYTCDWLEWMVQASKMDNCGLITTINSGGRSGKSYLEGFDWVGTWSMYIPRQTINKVGLFDENFSPGPGDDIDFTYRVVMSGLIVYKVPFWIEHHRMTEHQNDDIEDIKIRNAEYFRKKHSLDKIPNLDKAKEFWKVAKFFKDNEDVDAYRLLDLPFHKNKKIVDYGCGQGSIGRKFLDSNELYFVDIIKSNIEHIKSNTLGENVNCILLEKSEEIPLESESIDMIICYGVLHHIPYPEPVINEFKRILKRGGIMYIMLYTEYLSRELKETDPLKLGEKTDGFYSDFYTEEEGIELFKEFTLKEVVLFNNKKFRLFKLIK